MKFSVPSKFPTFKREQEHFKWWSITLLLPFIYLGEETQFCDIIQVFKLEAPTGFKFRKNEGWHSFSFTILGFGISYGRQWDY
jgi:hypothetical protein